MFDERMLDGGSIGALCLGIIFLAAAWIFFKSDKHSTLEVVSSIVFAGVFFFLAYLHAGDYYQLEAERDEVRRAFDLDPDTELTPVEVPIANTDGGPLSDSEIVRGFSQERRIGDCSVTISYGADLQWAGLARDGVGFRMTPELFEERIQALTEVCTAEPSLSD